MKFEIKASSEVPEKVLNDFFNITFPERAQILTKKWKWVNRSDFFNSTTPLSVLYHGKVIAHAGMIPIILVYSKCEYIATWFIDFAVLPEFQNQGIGIAVTREWLAFADVNITFCNHKSIRVFKKIGWIESFDTYLNFHPVRIFDHPAIIKKIPLPIRKALNMVSVTFYRIIYTVALKKNNEFSLSPISEFKEEELQSIFRMEKPQTENCFEPLRDNNFIKWRIISSPNYKKYLIYKSDTFFALILPNDNHGSYLDILWVSDTKDQRQIKELISRIGIYGIKAKISYIRFYSSSHQVSSYLIRNLIGIKKNPRFAYYSKNTSLFNLMKQSKWDFQLLDCDFEKI